MILPNGIRLIISHTMIRRFENYIQILCDSFL